MREQDIVGKAREIVDRHSLPDFIWNYDICLDDFDGDPALWVVFRVTPGPDRMGAEVDRRVTAMKALHGALRPELLAAFEDRFAYFRYESVALQPTVAAGD